jgi:hypothetical protein
MFKQVFQNLVGASMPIMNEDENMKLNSNSNSNSNDNVKENE